LSPTLFNIYMNEIIVEWNQIYAKGIALSTSTKVSTLLFAHNQVIIALNLKCASPLIIIQFK
jgi:hypothetical protein